MISLERSDYIKFENDCRNSVNVWRAGATKKACRRARLPSIKGDFQPAGPAALTAVGAAHRAGAKVGLCGQAPSDHPEFAEFLVECGIDSMSLSPDSFVAVKRIVAAAEASKGA